MSPSLTTYLRETADFTPAVPNLDAAVRSAVARTCLHDADDPARLAAHLDFADTLGGPAAEVAAAVRGLLDDPGAVTAADTQRVA